MHTAQFRLSALYLSHSVLAQIPSSKASTPSSRPHITPSHGCLHRRRQFRPRSYMSSGTSYNAPLHFLGWPRPNATPTSFNTFV
ncbi:hypothetical protein C8F04DRAFT_1129970 [Mycena alexandri]|uniref:Secreted protein n=1 Tax=Mycena alexandri TaxID=1745969 RepID=A0AAD6SBS9_9AGAR|nr:hypothetical protein C8F04DRAFT_1158590 [Mycena alexandri]KAJ7024949.1 hypothetical protein C8F04DRAFT_1129970 [Mycena alexandri]